MYIMGYISKRYDLGSPRPGNGEDLVQMWTGLDTLTDGKAVAHWVQEKPSTPIIFDTPHVEPQNS